MQTAESIYEALKEAIVDFYGEDIEGVDIIEINGKRCVILYDFVVPDGVYKYEELVERYNVDNIKALQKIFWEYVEDYTEISREDWKHSDKGQYGGYHYFCVSP